MHLSVIREFNFWAFKVLFIMCLLTKGFYSWTYKGLKLRYYSQSKVEGITRRVYSFIYEVKTMDTLV